MHALLVAYERDLLSTLTPDRRHTAVRVLRDFTSRQNGHSSADALRAFLVSLQQRGYADSTVRKSRAIVLAFASWAWREGLITANDLLELREVRLTARSAGELLATPYRPGELRKLRATLGDRWPRLDDDEAIKWLNRYADGRSPYARIRSHTVRCQLEALIALALQLGLRRREIYALDLVAAHPDNDYVVVGHSDAGSDSYRTVPYTDAAREAMSAWITCHWRLARGSTTLWLNTWAGSTATQPMTRQTFDRLLGTYVGPGWTLKRLRDTCVVAWLRAGLPLEQTRELLGLSSIAGVLPYAASIGGSLDGRMGELDAQFSELVGAVERTDLAR